MYLFGPKRATRQVNQRMFFKSLWQKPLTRVHNPPNGMPYPYMFARSSSPKGMYHTYLLGTNGQTTQDENAPSRASAPAFFLPHVAWGNPSTSYATAAARGRGRRMASLICPAIFAASLAPVGASNQTPMIWLNCLVAIENYASIPPMSGNDAIVADHGYWPG